MENISVRSHFTAITKHENGSKVHRIALFEKEKCVQTDGLLSAAQD